MALDPDRVEKELTDVMNEVWVEDSPFIADFVEGKVPKENLARFAPSYCYQVEQFKRCVAAVYVQAEPHDVRALMLANLEEEHGEGDPSRDHTELIARVGRALGAELPDPFDVEPIPESREWVERILTICREEDFVVGLAALSYGIEARTRTMGFLAAIYKDRYGLTDHDLEFFTMHLLADEDHAARAIEMIRTYCTTEELLERSKWAVRQVLDAHALAGRGMARLVAS
jgi:pyrroloquinoline-quinone synthase